MIEISGARGGGSKGLALCIMAAVSSGCGGWPRYTGSGGSRAPQRQAPQMESPHPAQVTDDYLRAKYPLIQDPSMRLQLYEKDRELERLTGTPRR